MTFEWVDDQTLLMLHLSDFHQGKDDQGLRVLHQELLAEIKQNVTAANRSPDLVFLTGDIANKGKEYARFIKQFLQPMKDLLPDARVFMVPGNHDVDRLKAAPAHRYDMLEACPRFFDPTKEGLAQRRSILPRFQAYIKHLQPHTPCDWLRKNAGTHAEVVSVRGMQVGVLLLNTAWLAGTDEDEGKLRLTVDMVRHGLQQLEGVRTIFVLGHHPLSSLHPDDRVPLRALFGRHHVVYLSGHVHRGAGSREDGAGEDFLALSAGAAFAAREDRVWVNGFQWYGLDPREESLLVHPLHWHRDHQNWVTDTGAFPKKRLAGHPNWYAFRMPGWTPAGNPSGPSPLPPDPSGKVSKVPTDDELPLAELFVGRDAPLKALCDGLQETAEIQVVYQLQGMGGVGKTTLAREAARRLAPHFDHVFEFLADGLTPERLPRDLAARLGLPPCEPATPDEARRLLAQLTRDRRLLLLLDNVTDPGLLKQVLPQTGSCRYVVTTRDPDLDAYLRQQRADLTVHPLNLDLFTEEECLALFRGVMGDAYHADDDTTLVAIAERLGRLPVALRLAANRLVFPPYDTPAELLALLEGDTRLDALAAGDATDLRPLEAVYDLTHTGLSHDQERVLQQLAVCAEGPVPRDFLEALLGEDARRGAEDLHRAAWCTAAGRGPDRTYELHVLVRELVRRNTTDPAPRDRFLQVIHDTYDSEDVHFTRKDAWLPQCREAIRLWAHEPDPRQKSLVYDTFYKFCAQRGHGALCLDLADQVAEHFPDETRLLATVHDNKALTLKNFGQLDLAMGLHQQALALYEALDDQAGLQCTYGNQALILIDWGRLDDAMGLLEKQEAICIDLGDQAGLSASYGNQALILKGRGRLDDAMALLEKQEAICIDLGDQAGLSSSYGNQALILMYWGRLDEAMALNQKVEAICIDLGDQAGLSLCWWNMGEVFGLLGRKEAQKELWEKAIALSKQMGIPTEEDEKHMAELLREMEPPTAPEFGAPEGGL